ncbi:trypsin-like serine peptidase [Clostridium tetani]|uniref:Serine protease n=1 Tax=Clostridium tetani TaxID=1513 RepID=A0ABY0EQ96_CLOTA|nr:serine protease [Clostridium tetani]RXI42115.1 serine protease [Clostridium tetani]RXI57166.1 serine protease [Clostridium tetani]RXI72840.1 serine protease [Clostridium tetani]
MFKTKQKKLIASLLSMVMLLFTCSTSMVSAKEVTTNRKAMTIISKNLVTNEESKQIYYEGVEPGDKTSGRSNPYIPPQKTDKGPKKSIIGTDDRFMIDDTTAFPYSAIAYMEMTWEDGARYIGSAWMYGPNIAVTAGHCLYSSKNGGWPKEVVLYPGRNESSSPFGSAKAVTIHVPENYANNGDTNFDWGVIELDKNIGNTTGYFGASWQLDSLNNTNVDVTGYPGEKHRQMWTMNGDITSSREYKIEYTIDTTGGQSGCPVYSDDDHVSIAIHTNGDFFKRSNKATRITKGIFDFIESFR